jgi:hypothetical protein
VKENINTKTRRAYTMRARGTVVTRPDKEPEGVLADDARQIQKQRQERRIVSGRKPPRPIPNYICYAFLFPNYDPKTGKGCPRPLPRCRVCGYRIDPQEHHDCPGFTPKYPEHDEEWHERMEARQEAIREAKRNGLFFSEDEDDLSGYEDEPEEDWCDEDDGDPMWE